VSPVIPGKAEAVQRVAHWKSFDSDRRAFEKQLTAALRRGFSQQRAAVLAAFAHAQKKGIAWQAA
jgi:hypothetical protein